MIKLQVLHWINLARLYRCHLTFEDDQHFDHHYLMYPPIKGPFKYKKRIYCGDPRNINYLKQILNQIRPDIVICANLVMPELMKIVRDSCRIFIYVNHSVWSQEIIEQKIQENNLVKQYSIFSSLYVLPREIAMWRRLGMSERKLVTAKGLTFLDTVWQQNHQQNKLKMLKQYATNNPFLSDQQQLHIVKTILLIHNSSASGCKFPDGRSKSNQENSEDYYQILNTLNQYVEEHSTSEQPIHIFSKIGRRRDTLTETEPINQLHQSPHLSVIWPEGQDHLMAEFLFADIILIQGFSTALYEALLVTPRVIQCYPRGKIILPTSQLPAITEISSQLKITLDKLVNDDQKPNDQLQNEINQLMLDSFGQAKIGNVTQQIMTDLREIYQLD